MFLIHLLTSAHKMSNSWCCVGAVQGILGNGCVQMNQITAHASTALLPTPWPLRTVVIGLAATLRSIFACSGSGLALITSSVNSTGRSA